MSKEKLVELYKQRNYTEKQIEQAVNDIEKLEKYLKEKLNKDIGTIEVEDIKKYINFLIDNDKNSVDTIYALARYFYLSKQNDIYIYFTKLTGGSGVIENIRERSEKFAGTDSTSRIFDDLNQVPLGSPPSEYPEFTANLMDNILKELPEDKSREILTGNNHGIPKESFAKEHEYFLNAPDIDTFLKEMHDRKVATLQYHCDNDIVWFEQKITQKVVDHVKSDQEILSAVRKGDKLYVTKIPYDTEGYLDAKTSDEKKYYACHCPYVREMYNNKDKRPEIDGNWCYCSAGFTKTAFDNILGQNLKVQVLESVVKGDERCRFELAFEE